MCIESTKSLLVGNDFSINSLLFQIIKTRYLYFTFLEKSKAYWYLNKSFMYNMWVFYFFTNMSSFNIVAKLWLGFLNCVHFEFAWSIVILFWYLEPVIIRQDYFECKIFLLFYQGSNDPQFLKTIGFGDKDGVDLNMRVKITVYHVKERLTGTVSIRLPRVRLASW